jgi:hypothetical protein
MVKRQNWMPEQHPWTRVFHDLFDLLSIANVEAVCLADTTWWLGAMRTLVDPVDGVRQKTAAIVAEVASDIVLVATIYSDHLFDGFFSNFFSDFIFPKGTNRGQTDTIDMSPLYYKQFSVISYNFKSI